MEELFILNYKFLLWTEVSICQQQQFYLLSICKNRLTEALLIIKSMFSSYMLCIQILLLLLILIKKSTPCLLCSFSTKAFKRLVLIMGFNIQRGKKKTNKHTNNDGWTAWLSANFSAGTALWHSKYREKWLPKLLRENYWKANSCAVSQAESSEFPRAMY